MSRERRTSEDVVPVGTEDENTPQRYMMVMLKSFEFGVPYSSDGLPTTRKITPIHTSREGTVSFVFNNGAPFVLGFDGRKRWLRKNVTLDHADKFKNVIVYAGPAEHVNMQVIVEETDEQMRRVFHWGAEVGSFVGQVFTGASAVASIVPHPYAQAGGLGLNLLASASRIAAAASEFAKELVDDDIELHAVEGIIPDGLPRAEGDPVQTFEVVRPTHEGTQMRLCFELHIARQLTHKRLLNVVIREGRLHPDTFGDSKKKQLVLECQLGTGGEDEKRSIITQRTNQGHGATLDRVCTIRNMLLGNLVCETHVVPFTATASVVLTERAKEQAKALAKFVNKVGPELTQSMGYAYQLYSKLRTAKLEEEQRELTTQAHADRGEELRANRKVAELQRRIAELPDGARKDALQAQLDELQMESNIEKEIRTARAAERDARTKELAWLVENLKKPKGALDGFAHKIATDTDAKEALEGLITMGPQRLEELAKEMDSKTMADWKESYLIPTDFTGTLWVKFFENGSCTISRTPPTTEDTATKENPVCKSYLELAVTSEEGPAITDA